MKLATVIEIDKGVIDACISLRKALKIKLPDALIAATALSKKLTLVSRNTSDFDKVTGLKLVNPHDL